MLLYNLLSLFGFVYAFAAIAISFIGFSKSWLEASNQHVLSFRKPKLMRLGAGMISLLCLCFLPIILADTRPTDLVLVWCSFGTASIGLFGLLFYLSGPQDVLIDLDARTCHGTDGWMFSPRRRICPLTEASSLRVWAGGYSWYVVLWTGGKRDPMFLLAKPASKSAAVSFAQEIADKLHLPVNETTLGETRKLS